MTSRLTKRFQKAKFGTLFKHQDKGRSRLNNKCKEELPPPSDWQPEEDWDPGTGINNEPSLDSSHQRNDSGPASKSNQIKTNSVAVVTHTQIAAQSSWKEEKKEESQRKQSKHDLLSGARSSLAKVSCERLFTTNIASAVSNSLQRAVFTPATTVCRSCKPRSLWSAPLMTESSLLADAVTFVVAALFKGVLLLFLLVDVVFEFAFTLPQFLVVGLDLARATVVGHFAAHFVQISRAGRHQDTHQSTDH